MVKRHQHLLYEVAFLRKAGWVVACKDCAAIISLMFKTTTTQWLLLKNTNNGRIVNALATTKTFVLHLFLRLRGSCVEIRI